MTRRPKSLAQLKEQCDRWNKKNAIGAKVLVRRDNGNIEETKTRSEAYVLSGHSAVVFVEGISGCYSLDRVEAV